MISHQPAHGVLTHSVTRSALTPATCLAFLVGAWLVLSPAVLGYADSAPWWNPMGAGTLLALVALARAAGIADLPRARVVNALAGLWLLTSAGWLAGGSAAGWNLAACGAAAVALAVAAERAPA